MVHGCQECNRHIQCKPSTYVSTGDWQGTVMDNRASAIALHHVEALLLM